MTSTHLVSPMHASLLQRFLQFPVTRIVLGILCFLAPFLLIQAVAINFIDDQLLKKMAQFFGAVVGCVCYGLYVRTIEKRVVSELNVDGFLGEFGLGFAIGGGYVCATIGVIALFGGFHIIGMSPWSVLLIPLLSHLTIALIEELLTRGIIFRIVQQSLGSWFALVASGVVFGGIHLANDNISVLGFASSSVAGVLLAAAFLVTGRLWLCVAIHAADNFFQSGVFSLAVSGHDASKGLFMGELNGPDWLTGGAFGIEGSAIYLAINLIVMIVLIKVAQNKGHMVLPFWKRSA